MDSSELETKLHVHIETEIPYVSAFWGQHTVVEDTENGYILEIEVVDYTVSTNYLKFVQEGNQWGINHEIIRAWREI